MDFSHVASLQPKLSQMCEYMVVRREGKRSGAARAL